MSSTIIQARLAGTSLLGWYDQHRRQLPWRALPGEAADPYRVWLSEIMLQQTTVSAVIPYYERFVSRYPDVASLASAPLDDVLVAWAGLGYYARARNLHSCARAVVARGGFPRDLESLRALPGIGEYTAAAIGAIAFGVPVVPVDGNVERVVARLFAIEDALPACKPKIKLAATVLGTDPVAKGRPSDFAQALFDLGATVCTPTTPACSRCPLSAECAARCAGIAAVLPRKAARKPRLVRHGVHFCLTDSAGMILLRRRPAHGLLGGMAELPGTPWRAEPWTVAEARAYAPVEADWRPAGQIKHPFTHFELVIELMAAETSVITANGLLRRIVELENEALPSVMRKCVAMLAATANHPLGESLLTSVQHSAED